MQRAIVIGSPGAGKSTFARRLRDAAGEVRYGIFAGFAMGGLPLGGESADRA